MQIHSTQQVNESHKTQSDFVIISFLKKLETQVSNENLESLKADLNYLCFHFDPYTNLRDKRCSDILADLDLEATLQNPFEFTKKVLQMLDLLEEKMKQKLQ
jgi:hypothetical protein